MNTFVKLSRRILDWEWYHDDGCKAFLLHLLLRANWTEKKFENTTTVKPGELITSINHLAMELGKSPQQIRTLIKKLKSSGTISILSNKGYTHIKLNKYCTFEEDALKRQQDNNKDITDHQQGLNTEPTEAQHSSNNSSTTTKEYNKKIKEEGNKNINSTFQPTKTFRYGNRLCL